MKKFFKILLCMIIFISLVGCSDKKENNNDVKNENNDKKYADLYYDYIKKFSEEKNTDVYIRFNDINYDGISEMLFGYKDGDVNNLTVLYIKNDKVINPGFISGVNMVAQILVDSELKYNWTYYTGDETDYLEGKYYLLEEFLEENVDVKNINPIFNGDINKLKSNYVFGYVFYHITKFEFTEDSKEMFVFNYETGLEEHINEESLKGVKKEVEEKLKKSNDNKSSDTFKVGEYDVKFGKYEWITPDGAKEYYTLNSDYTCNYVDYSGKSSSCTFSVGIATDGQDISSAVETDAIIIKGEYQRNYFPIENGFRDTDMELFEYIG